MPDCGIQHAQQRAFYPHRVVITRRHLIGSIKIVDDIDAANKADSCINQRHLAVHAPQPVAMQAEARQLRAKEHHPHSGLQQGM